MLLIGVSYALWIILREQDTENRITSSCISIELESVTEEISLSNAIPLTDEDGMNTTPYTFTIKNTCTTFISYDVIFLVDSESTLGTQYVDAVLDRNVIKTLDQYESREIDNQTGYILQSGNLSQADEITYNLRMWLDEEVTVDDPVFNTSLKGKIRIEAKITNYSPIDQGFKTLADAMLVNEYQSSTVESAKQQIESKQAPDFSNTAPIITWNEVHANTTSEATTNASMYIGTSYHFDSETGYYYIENYGDPQNYTDISNEEYTLNDYYTCVGNKTTSSTGDPSYWRPTNCTSMYKITGAEEYQENNETRWRITAYVYTQNEQESDASDKGLYMGTDNYGDTYYYRGNVNNNYVYFAGYYWRIVRLNGDGSVRLLYAGTSANSTGSALTIDRASFNTQKESPAYVGYMYGSTINESYEQNVVNEVSSSIKIKLDSWYKTNIEDKGFSEYIADSGFCNDRSLDSGDGVSTTLNTNFGGQERYVNHTPSLVCPQQNDLFTVNNAEGNQALTYPIGLITSDEMAFSGMSNGILNRSVYSYISVLTYTMSPLRYTSSGSAWVWTITGKGALDYASVTDGGSIRPVINLASTVEIESGIGTANDPYVINVS